MPNHVKRVVCRCQLIELAASRELPGRQEPEQVRLERPPDQPELRLRPEPLPGQPERLQQGLPPDQPERLRLEPLPDRQERRLRRLLDPQASPSSFS